MPSHMHLAWVMAERKDTYHSKFASQLANDVHNDEAFEAAISTHLENKMFNELV